VPVDALVTNSRSHAIKKRLDELIQLGDYNSSIDFLSDLGALTVCFAKVSVRAEGARIASGGAKA
jgi:hypothetical protein